jgi:hypothetical protein
MNASPSRAARYEEAHVRGAQRLDRQNMVADRGVQGLEVSIEGGQQRHDVVLARALDTHPGFR